MGILCKRLCVSGSMLTWLLFALIFDPMTCYALNVEDPYHDDAPGVPCSEIGEHGRQACQDPEESMPWFHEVKNTAADQIITFWLEYPTLAGTAASANHDSMPVALFGAVPNPSAFATYGEIGANSGDNGPTVKYLSLCGSPAQDYSYKTPGSIVRRAVWMIPAGVLVIFIILSMVSAALVVNNRYVFGDLRHNLLRSDSTLSWSRVGIEVRRFLNLNTKVFAIILLYLAGSAFLFFMLQQFANPGPSAMEVIDYDQDRPVERGEMDREPESEPGLEDYYSEFLIYILLFVGVTGYIVVIRPSRFLLRRYKKGLHQRRRFYSNLDRRRILKNR